MLHDIFLHLPPPASASASAAAADAPPSYLMDHPTIVTDSLRKYLKRHILRLKVKMPKPSSPGGEGEVRVAWRNLEEEVSEEQQEEAESWLARQVGAGRDERVEGMGWRWCAAAGGDDARKPAFFPRRSVQFSSAHSPLRSPNDPLPTLDTPPLPPPPSDTRRSRRARGLPPAATGGECRFHGWRGL